GKPDRAVIGMDDDIVRSIQRFAVRLIGECGDRPVMLEANHARSLAGDLPSLEIERVAIGFVGRFAEVLRDVSAAIFEIAKLPVVRNIAPDQILALRIPGRSLRPQAASIEPLDGRIADLRLEALGVDDDDVWIGIALGRCVRAEVTCLAAATDTFDTLILMRGP